MIRSNPDSPDEVVVSRLWLNRIYRLEWLAVALLTGASVLVLGHALNYF